MVQLSTYLKQSFFLAQDDMQRAIVSALHVEDQRLAFNHCGLQALLHQKLL
jgi:hypothetical protein